MENNTWVLTIAAVALVAIVAVFGMVQMTGYMTMKADVPERASIQAQISTGAILISEVDLEVIRVKQAVREKCFLEDSSAEVLFAVVEHGDLRVISPIVVDMYGIYNPALTAWAVKETGLLISPTLSDKVLAEDPVRIGTLLATMGPNHPLVIGGGGDEWTVQ